MPEANGPALHDLPTSTPGRHRGGPGRGHAGYNQLAAEYGVKPFHIGSHKRAGHIPASILEAFGNRPRSNLSKEMLAKVRAEESASLLTNLGVQRAKLLRVQDQAERRRNGNQVIHAASQIHRNIELVARALGEFAQHERSVVHHTQLNLLLSPEYVRLRAKLIEAVRAHPKARDAITHALQEIEGEAVRIDGLHPAREPRLIEARADG